MNLKMFVDFVPPVEGVDATPMSFLSWTPNQTVWCNVLKLCLAEVKLSTFLEIAIQFHACTSLKMRQLLHHSPCPKAVNALPSNAMTSIGLNDIHDS